ncbi:rho guanine nucleotide exchange factor 4 isoform x1 [Plakobranchus ocellatus]|uniref:Rho guanine nucleotide exchange factor 4 isoform x1 n=1 Tax=Plakobranchus ocellatus TaxID=259542 RepID=A0AAV3YYS6_9GAST|nr:rho guanine nucleotide exchange factor 4 isoform x1 [Plakobranchus ocellatus]
MEAHNLYGELNMINWSYTVKAKAALEANGVIDRGVGSYNNSNKFDNVTNSGVCDSSYKSTSENVLKLVGFSSSSHRDSGNVITAISYRTDSGLITELEVNDSSGSNNRYPRSVRTAMVLRTPDCNNKCEDLFIFVDAGHRYICQYKSIYKPPPTTTEMVTKTEKTTMDSFETTMKTTQSTVMSDPPQSTMMSNPPQTTTVMSNPPQTTTMMSNPPTTTMMSNPPQTTAMMSNPPQTTTMTNPPTTKMLTNPPTTTTMTNPPTTKMMTNAPTTTMMTNPSTTTTMTNPPTTKMMTNPPTTTTMTNPPTTAMMTNPPTTTTMTTPPQSTIMSSLQPSQRMANPMTTQTTSKPGK